MMRWAPLVLAISLSAACGPPQIGPGTGGTVEGVWWTLESFINDQGWVETFQRAPGQRCVPSLQVEGGQHTADDCGNAFSGSTPISGVTIRFIYQDTSPAETDAFALTYQDNLRAARTFTATEDELDLFDTNNYQVTVFRASATDPTR